MQPPLRAAVLGAGRIGKHHAKWLVRSGCELSAFLVSNSASLDSRAAALAEECQKIGPGYTSLQALLDEQELDLVTVATPAEAHHPVALAALDRGLSVFCEKPLCWHTDVDRAVADAEELVATAAQRNLKLGVNLQYTLAGDHYRQMIGAPSGPSRCHVTLESRGKGTVREPDEVWMELGPHAISLALALVPDSQPELSSVSATASPGTAEVTFNLATSAGPVAVELQTAQRMEGDLVRRFGLDDRLVDYAGRSNAAGEYCCYLSIDDREEEFKDLMQDSIEGFVAAVAGNPRARWVDGALGLDNLRIQVAGARHLAAAREGRSDG